MRIRDYTETALFVALVYAFILVLTWGIMLTLERRADEMLRGSRIIKQATILEVAIRDLKMGDK